MIHSNAVRVAAVGSRLPWGGIRLGIVVLGGLLVLQSSPELDATKLAYLLVSLVALGAGLRRIVAAGLGWRSGRYGQLLVLDAALIGLLGGSFLVAQGHGTPPVDWFRDVVSYALFAAIPVLAWDAGTSSSSRFLVTLLVITGIMASASWTLEWLNRRELADLPIDRLFLPAGRIATALYALALAVAIHARGLAWRWAVLAGAVLGLLFVSGTRSSLLVLLVPLMIALLVRARPWSHKGVILASHLAAALVVFVLVGNVLAGTGTHSPDAPVDGEQAPAEGAAERIGSIGTLAERPLDDASVRERIAQYRAAWDLFASSPVVGVGPGHVIEWTDVSGYPRSDFTADTPLVLPAKFGVVGLVVVGLVAVAYVAYLAGAVRKLGWVPATLALGAFVLGTGVGLPLGMAVEDKAFSFALAMLLAIVIAEMAGRVEPSKIGKLSVHGS